MFGNKSKYVIFVTFKKLIIQDFVFTSIQQNSLHIDLRLLNKIEFDKYNLNVRFGSGLIWADVLKVVDPKRYTVIHGSVSLLYLTSPKAFLTIS